MPKLADMELDDEDKLDFCAPIECPSPDFPYGLRICLSEKEMAKLKMSMPEVGEYVEIRGFACVKSVSSDSTDRGETSRVELQIEKLAVGGYEEEEAPPVAAPRRRRLYRST